MALRNVELQERMDVEMLANDDGPNARRKSFCSAANVAFESPLRPGKLSRFLPTDTAEPVSTTQLDLKGREDGNGVPPIP